MDFYLKINHFLGIVIHHKERGWLIVTNQNKKRNTRFSSRTQIHLLTDSNSFLVKPTTIFVSNNSFFKCKISFLIEIGQFGRFSLVLLAQNRDQEDFITRSNNFFFVKSYVFVRHFMVFDPFVIWHKSPHNSRDCYLARTFATNHW